jgi:hypothetical protein
VDPTLLPSPTIINPAFGSFLKDLSQTITGTCTDGNTITFIGNITPAVSVVCAGGNYTANVTFVAGEGSKMLQATQTDSNGVVSLPSVVHYMFDNVPPSKPIVTSPAEGSIVSDNKTKISGTGESKATVTVASDGSTCQTIVDSFGKWSCSLDPELADGSHDVLAVQVDLAGNTSEPSDKVTFSIDTSVPDSPTIDNPVDGSFVGDINQVIEGTCTDGFLVELRGNITPSPQQALCVSGSFSIPVILAKENK